MVLWEHKNQKSNTVEIDLRLCEIFFFYKSKKDGFLKFVRLRKSILRERRVLRLYINITHRIYGLWIYLLQITTNTYTTNETKQK